MVQSTRRRKDWSKLQSRLQDLPGHPDALLPHQVDIRTLGNPSDQDNWRDGMNLLLASNNPLPSKPSSECSILTQHPELRLPEEGELVLWSHLYGFDAIERAFIEMNEITKDMKHLRDETRDLWVKQLPFRRISETKMDRIINKYRSVLVFWLTTNKMRIVKFSF